MRLVLRRSLGLPIHARRTATWRDARGPAAPATAQKPATLVCECTRRWRMRCPLQRGRDVAPTRPPSQPMPRFFSFPLFRDMSTRGPQDFRTELREILNEKRNQLDREGPSTDLWDYKHARAHGGGRKRRRGPRLCRSTREVHEGEGGGRRCSCGDSDSSHEGRCCLTSYGTTATRSHT